MKDTQVRALIGKEQKRQADSLNLIASENFVSPEVLYALGSVFTNKYAEGYSRMRYYGGNEVVDELEDLAKKRALKLFGLTSSRWHVNVQPYSGSPANLAVYLALVPLGEKIMGMALNMGGHLTHGHKVSATGKLWKFFHFGVDEKTERLDYKIIRKLAKKEKPKLIVAGFTAYSRTIDFAKLRRIADEVKAFLMVDMSHFAGLVAGKAYPSPFAHAHVVTTTTHKTLRGPRSALIFCKKEFTHLIDKAVFPGLQGGPHVNQIAAAAVCLAEAASPKFLAYAMQVRENARTLAGELSRMGWRIVSGGTDSHLFLLDTWKRGVSGKQAQELLERVKIIVNKNTIPYDKRSPIDPSGIRIGTPALTTRGMKEREMKEVAFLIHDALMNVDTKVILKRVNMLCRKFSIA